MGRALRLLLVLTLIIETTTGAATRGKNVKYVGGTVTTLRENTQGKMEIGESAATFVASDGGKLTIPFSNIESLEYGQKAGRRVGVALAVSPLFLLSKKRKHFLTIGFQDAAGKKQGAVFELAKGIVHETLTTFENKSGKNVDYESDEARKHAEGH